MEENYLPLFRKYRPQSFDDVVGQESLVKALSNAIELNRIANAYLFSGPRGTGKTSCARIFAKSLNCELGPTLKPCQKCASCVDITNASGLDVIEIDAASNRGIQDAKDLISRVQYAPINGKYKIFIIDEVHMLSNDAFNALLKTFEEPPKNVIFILATTEPHKVLETIVSRCQRFDLRRITTDDIVKRLRKISDMENIKITQEALFTIAKNVSGGLRDSLALLDQVSILGAKEEINKETIEELLGKINFDTLLDLLKTIYKEDISKTTVLVNEIYSKGSEPRNLAENFIEFLRNVILVINSDNYEQIKNISSLIDDDIRKINDENFDKDKIIKILNIVIDYYKEIKVSTNPYLWMELASIAACKPYTIKSENKGGIIKNEKIIIPSKKISADEVKKEETIEPAKEEIKEETMEETGVQGQKDAAQIWSDILSSIPSAPVKAFYSGVAKLVGVENKKIIIGFLFENALLQAKNPTKLSQLENALNSCYQGYNFEFRKIDNNTKTIEARPQKKVSSFQKQHEYTPPETKKNFENPIKEEKKEDEEEVDNEKKYYSSKVQDMIEQYSGRIVE